jgi:hypothetical protein
MTRSRGHFIFFSLCFIYFLGISQSVLASSLGTKGNPVRMMFVPSGEANVILKGGEKIGDLRLAGYLQLCFRKR